MALIDFSKQSLTGVTLGTRNDSCYLCTKAIVAPNEREYNKQKNALVGTLEGKKVLKIGRVQGSEICVCMECINKIAKANPVEAEEIPSEPSEDTIE